MSFIDYLDSGFDTKLVSNGTQIQVSGPCPFCGADKGNDTRIYVNPKSGLGMCHHCSKGFSPVAFVAAHEGCSRKEAAAILDDLGDGFLSSEEDTPESSEEMPWPHTIPVEDSVQAGSYLDERGIGEDLIEHFGIAYCPRNTEIQDSEWVVYTKGRLFIPIIDIEGNKVAWQGRDTTGRARNKYLFPKGFKGAEYVYNANGVQQGAPFLIVAEGVFDVFGWWRAGFKNVVGTFGHKISRPQVDILIDLAPKRIVIAWDSDSSWEKYEFVEKYGHLWETRICDLEGWDADELDRPKLANALRAARPYSWADKITTRLIDSAA